MAQSVVKNISESNIEIVLSGWVAPGVPKTFLLKAGQEEVLDVDPTGKVLKARIEAGLIVVSPAAPPLKIRPPLPAIEEKAK